MDQEFFFNCFDKEVRFLEECQIDGIRPMPYILSDLYSDSDPEVTIISNDLYEFTFFKATDLAEIHTKTSNKNISSSVIRDLIIIDRSRRSIEYHLTKILQLEASK
ncbi:hypothetical protein [Sporolactobacillus nakayamae]|uniref:Uncharacterized protein n=1 Tax=Sporolactobacillus nakayamae TaxID=269670 RepID=A0A1I2U100_9BACL|nr:hypothetical protein [Sporolactobacillus nakayamae]SFG70663.1 hypothetical protein SAMN02982927_02506 [Sporolactobacillus nakayamae]